jgi:hypothetical protein
VRVSLASGRASLLRQLTDESPATPKKPLAQFLQYFHPALFLKGEPMKKILGVLVSVLVGVAMASAAEQTWHGKISDSMCGASHKSAIEHSGKKLTDRECVQACIKEGAKYVFVSGGKVYNISNQDDPALAEHAGHAVTLKGEMTGDTIKVSSISMGKAAGKMMSKEKPAKTS